MTSYSTLQEAYNIDSFNTVRKKPKKSAIYAESEQTAATREPFMNDYSPQDDCYYKKEYGVDTKVCRNQYSGVRGSGGPGGPSDSSISRFTNPSPQGAQQHIVRKSEANPSYVETSKLSMNSTEVHGYKSHQMNTQGNSCSPLQPTNYDYPLSGECKKEFDKAMKTYTSDATVNNVPYQGSETKSIQPYYDEDLEQYFDINNMTDAIHYKSSNTSFMPNANASGYANDNTGEYRNMQTKSSKVSDDLLRTEEYNLSEDDKKQALQALSVLQSIEAKINQQKAQKPIDTDAKPQEEKKPEEKKPEEKKPEEKKPNTFYNNLINIGLFIFIGVVFILLCDQITELAIQIGMKRAINILEPYLQKPGSVGGIGEVSSISPGLSSISNTVGDTSLTSSSSI
jgi:hypothetical protein